MQALRRTYLTDSVIKEVERMIVAAELQGGQRLPSEKELAARFGVGRSTIREAMKALVMMEMVDRAPGRGAFVRTDAQDVLAASRVVKMRLQSAGVKEVSEARYIIESELAFLAAERATPADIIQIEEALADMRRDIADDAAYTESDLRFHTAVARAAKNRVLEQFYCYAHGLLAEVGQDAVKLPSVKTSGFDLHISMFEQIKRRNPESARSAALKLMRHRQRVVEEVGTKGE